MMLRGLFVILLGALICLAVRLYQRRFSSSRSLNQSRKLTNSEHSLTTTYTTHPGRRRTPCRCPNCLHMRRQNKTDKIV